MKLLKGSVEFFRIIVSIIPILLFMLVMMVWYAFKQPNEPIGKFVDNKISKRESNGRK